MKSRLTLLLLLALACDRPTETPAAVPAPAAETDVAGNLLDLARGASVISRTGEHSYENSAAHAIDGDILTPWISPPGGPEQTLVLSFATRVRVRRLGLATTPGDPVQQLHVASSLDGAAWTAVATLSFEPKAIPQIRDVTPFEARFLRIRTIAPGQHFSLITTVYAIGDELGPPSAGSIDGCWTIDGRSARFEQRGAQIHGVIAPRPDTNDRPIQIDGGFDGRTNRLAWRAGAQWGFAILTVSPDGLGLSGLRWHERTDNEGSGDGWLGPRGPCAGLALDPQAVRTRVLAELRRYPLYGLRFDAQDRLLVDESRAALDVAATATRLVSHGRKAQLESLRAALAARGIDTGKIEFVDAPERPFKTLAQRILNGSIEIETR